jgi:hypothetical protein
MGFELLGMTRKEGMRRNQNKKERGVGVCWTYAQEKGGKDKLASMDTSQLGPGHEIFWPPGDEPGSGECGVREGVPGELSVLSHFSLSLSDRQGTNTGGRSPAGLPTELLGVVNARVREGSRPLGRAPELAQY